VQSGEVTIEQAVAQLRLLPYQDLGFAKIDHHRTLRRGFPEVVLGQGKTAGQIAAIVEQLAAQADKILVTRVDPECFALVQERVPQASYHPIARAISVDRAKEAPRHPGVMVISGGTADLPRG
jgi:hypothetical protein